MLNSSYLAVPIICVRFNLTGGVHIVGTNQHDRLYLDENGQIQYENIQCMGGTKDGEYSFVTDLIGKDPVTNRYKEDEFRALTDDEIYEVQMEDPIDYARTYYVNRIIELDNRIYLES